MSWQDRYEFYEREWERYEDLREWFEWEVPERFNMAHYVCDRWAEDGDERVAFYAESASGERRDLTFRDLRARANRLANALSAAGVERGDRVGVCLRQRPEAAVAHVAAWKLGAVSVPLSTQFGEDALAYRLGDCRATACVVGEASVDTLRAVRPSLDALEATVTVGTAADQSAGETDWDDVRDRSPEFETEGTDAEEDALIIYTSGTTGDPKGVLHAHRTLLGHLPSFAENFLASGTEGTVFWTPVEWSWIGSLFSVVMPALYYGRPVVAREAARFDPEEAFSLLERYEVTNLATPPTALRMMMQVESPADRYDLGAMRSVGAGGEPVGESVGEWVAETFDAPLEEAYGQTEANLVVGDCAALADPRPGMMGLPVPGHDVAIVDPQTAEATVETGEVGEIAVRYEGNPVCFVEYWNEPERTAEKVRDGWLLTGDLGSMDEDGYVTFEGRTDDVILTSGYRVSPEEIEETLASHEDVVAAGVVGIPDDERGEVPKAFVVASGGRAATDLRSALMDRVKQRLAPYEYPREVEFLDELPTTSTGKVRRESLREREGAGGT
ncbi:acyl-CoA synthetase [Halomarina litorea]|uniref:acyl-CoA synthetase n=1 Tax=Halomarina litorea TaxID=2961595 RepID=UPI0020C22212|nr:AMP-binding protein [Halomarina sp. BCD28]